MEIKKNKPIRILHVIQSMEAGGAQTFLMNIYRNIDRNKIQFDFLVLYKKEQFYDEEIKKMGGSIYRLSFREDLNLISFQKELIDFFKVHDYSIVHCHAYTVGFFCLKAAYKAGIPVRIAHSHTNSVLNNLKKPFKIVVKQLYVKYATHLFACSEDAGNFMFGNKDFIIIPNSIDSSKFIADNKKRLLTRANLSVEDKFVVGHVGRFSREKNHIFLIDVFKEIKNINPNSELILIGNGNLSQKIKYYVEDNNLSDSVHFLGTRNDMDRLYQAMDVFIFPSLYEGFGIVGLEAQAAGVPVLCSETIPHELLITPIIKKISLDQGEKAWAIEAIELSKNKLSHTNMNDFIVSSGFNSKNNAKKLENFYLNNLYEREYHEC